MSSWGFVRRYAKSGDNFTDFILCHSTTSRIFERAIHEVVYSMERDILHREIGGASQDLNEVSTYDDHIDLPWFDSDVAWELGSHIRTRLRNIRPGNACLISITLANGQALFVATTVRGVTPDNSTWVARKTKTVLRFNSSSWFMSLKFARNEEAFGAKYGLGAGAGNYAIHGGGVPINVNGVESPVGVLVVSGLKQEEDHMVAVEALRWMRNELQSNVTST